MNNPTFDGIRGLVGENALRLAIAKTSTVKPISFETHQLLAIARSTKVGRQRLNAAKPFLLKEFGIPVRNEKSQSYDLILDWESIPNTIILDYIFGLDQTINFRGWLIGIDATVNSQAIDDKVAKLNWLKPLWKPLGIDHTAVCLLRSTGCDLVTGLRQILSGAKAIQLAK